jgi:polysaccharide chain length determinant protein (PEP-CTERM system associated)
MRPDERPTRPRPWGEPDPDEASLSWNQLQHYLHAPLRRPWFVALPWLGIIALSVIALFALPKKYRSTALILVESERVPDSFVPRVATEEPTRRVDNIRPEILSRTRLEKVLAETNPYPEMQSNTKAVETMRAAISVNQSGTDGFALEFVHRDPRKAQEVTDRLATLFISETVKSREQQVGDAIEFLVAQVGAARKELEAKDEALRRYKEARMGRLPEQLQTNLATLQMLQREMQTVEENLFLAREKQDALARGLSRGMQAAPGTPAPSDTSDLDALRDQLAQLRTRYTDEHPDVQSLRSRIARIEARLTGPPDLGAQGAIGASTAVARDQLARAGQEAAKLEERRGDLENRIAVLRSRVEDTPRTEQELANLTRDYNKLSDNYTALLSKQLDAQMAGRLEQRWKGDRFRVLDPASLPDKPDWPKPLPIIGVGVVLGFVVGMGAALAAEVLDRTVKDTEQLETLLPYRILAQVPHLPGQGGPSLR